MNRRATVALVLGLAVAGCGDERVDIATADSDICMLNWVVGELVASPAGVAIVAEEQNGKRELSITWAPGMTATRTRLGGIDIHAPDGRVVASTGQRIKLMGGYGDENAWTTCSDGVYPPE